MRTPEDRIQQRATARIGLGYLDSITEHFRIGEEEEYETWKKGLEDFKKWVFEESSIA